MTIPWAISEIAIEYTFGGKQINKYTHKNFKIYFLIKNSFVGNLKEREVFHRLLSARDII